MGFQDGAHHQKRGTYRGDGKKLESRGHTQEGYMRMNFF